jgi:hypothetical protein
MSLRPKRPHAMLLVFALGGGAALLLAAGIVGVAAVSFTPPSGPPLATRNLQPGQPFELKLAANGKSLRVWLDMQCDSCGYPVEGRMTVFARGHSIASGEISAGDTHDHAWGGHSRSLEDHQVFEAPARPAGEELTITGTLRVRGARGLLGGPLEGAPRPRMRLFRLTVTN